MIISHNIEKIFYKIFSDNSLNNKIQNILSISTEYSNNISQEILPYSKIFKNIHENIFLTNKNEKKNTYLLLEFFFHYNEKIKNNGYLNPTKYLSVSKIRGGFSQYSYLYLICGHIFSIRNFFKSIPITNNYSVGLNLIEYFLMCFNVRKGILDTSLNTSIAGYFSRKMGEYLQEFCIKEYYCGTKERFNYFNCYKNKLKYSPRLCLTFRGICNNCFGEGNYILFGKNIGILISQYISEPTTQIILKTGHTGLIDIIKKEKISGKKNNNFFIYNRKKICFFIKYKNIFKLYKQKNIFFLQSINNYFYKENNTNFSIKIINNTNSVFLISKNNILNLFSCTNIL